MERNERFASLSSPHIASLLRAKHVQGVGIVIGKEDFQVAHGVRACSGSDQCRAIACLCIDWNIVEQTEYQQPCVVRDSTL